MTEAAIQFLDQEKDGAAHFARILHGFLRAAVHVQDVISVTGEAFHVDIRGGALLMLYTTGMLLVGQLITVEGP
jgi:hypothetical protein